MKRMTVSWFAAILLGGVMACTLTVQGQDQKEQKPAVKPEAAGARPIIRDRTDIYAQRLGLNDEQKQKVKPILEEEFAKMNELRQQYADKKIKPEEFRNKAMEIREATKTKLKPILTQEQWDKYSKPTVRVTPAGQPGSAPAAPAAPAPAK